MHERTLRRLSAAALCALAAMAVLPRSMAAPTAIALTGQRRLNFDDGWRFFKGEAAGAEQPGFQDSAWTELRLPHDWAIEGPFDSRQNPHTGALPIFGTGWYRKAFTLPEKAKGQSVGVMFDGAMSNARVWLNGHELGNRPYGYISFSFDLTPFLNYGAGVNVLAVR
ncbi:MAG TPA: hypothetical protein VKF41_10445, partial [Bryobacteraceae bacterium]|nr:hypothetical protein [Bryobacteraceae bacterium]